MPEAATADGHRRPVRWRAIALVAVLCLIAGLVGWVGHDVIERLPGERSVDVGFLRDMSDHHDQAVRMALLELANGSEPLVKGFATDVIASQRYEIGLMEARLRDWGRGRGPLERSAMAWMGMGTGVAAMPGMASPERLAELATARGRDADALFLRLMTEHHEGGIHMGRYAQAHARTAAVRRLARIIASTQTVEIRDMEEARARLALPR